jgi:hypothetical protein
MDTGTVPYLPKDATLGEGGTRSVRTANCGVGGTDDCPNTFEKENSAAIKQRAARVRILNRMFLLNKMIRKI